MSLKEKAKTIAQLRKEFDEHLETLRRGASGDQKAYAKARDERDYFAVSKWVRLADAQKYANEQINAMKFAVIKIGEEHGQQLKELEARLEQARQLLNKEDFIDILSEGFHTAFRKAIESDEVAEIHRLIKQMPDEDWDAIIEFVYEGLGIKELLAVLEGKEEKAEATT